MNQETNSWQPEPGINDSQLRECVIQPVLEHLDLESDAAVQLLLATGRQESHLAYIQQLGGGPALGIYQMEPATHNDIWKNYLAYRPELAELVRSLAIGTKEIPDPTQMVGNLFYATAMCRIHYLRVPEPLPAADDIAGMGQYWKMYYNTHMGRGTVEEFIANNNPHLGAEGIA